MSSISSKGYSKSKEYSVIYDNLKGVDFSENGSHISKDRFAYAENMYRDYDVGGANTVESIPGYRRIYDSGNEVRGLYTYKNSSGEDVLVVHSKNELHVIPVSNIDTDKSAKVISGLSDLEGDGYVSSNALFILNGGNIFMLSDDFSGKITDDVEKVYIPTTHVNGTEYEQRNLLTRLFYEKYVTSSPELLAFGSPELRYAITDADAHECAVVGISKEISRVYIPSRVKIGDTYYAVKSIEGYTFSGMTGITYCFISNNVATIGEGAFKGCTSLMEISMPDTTVSIGDECFMGCSTLLAVRFGASLKTIGEDAFDGCTAISEIIYAADKDRFQKIANVNIFDGKMIEYNAPLRTTRIGLKIHNPATEIYEVSDGERMLDFTVIKNGFLCDEICVDLEDEMILEAKTITVKGLLSSSREDYADEHIGFLSANLKTGDTVSKIITECTVAETFDGRIFLTGNPKYPGFCFYSALDLSGENNPLYFGEMNYFKDGLGGFKNTALLAVGDSLAVFKEGDDGGGSIYYHTPRETGIDLLTKIYPVSYVHSGFVAKGEAISFFDDPIFVSAKGISALSKKNINLERSIATRSSNVNKRLLLEDLNNAKLTVWKGYLVVLCGDKIYLADSRSTFVARSGDTEYEWYYLTGIGSYRNDRGVYRYSATAHDGFFVHESVDKKTAEAVYSIKANGETVYYTNEGNRRFEVYPTEEREGGTFSPATHVITIGDRLIFATGDGQVLSFNTDKRGAAPPYLSDADIFDEEEYRREWDGIIHPYYYSFAGHAARYAIETKRDDCSIPHLTKNTVKGSLTLKCHAVAATNITCEVGTDSGGYKEISRFPSRDFFFADVDFSSFTMTTDGEYTIPIHEKEKNWIEKQITLYSDEFASPFAISIIAYRFFIKGQIKRNR